MVTQAYLKEYFRYCHETGDLIRIKTASTKRGLIGKPAGQKWDGYIFIKINKKRYSAHRLIWLYVYGKWPDGVIDHKNGVGTDNRLENLRDCSVMENALNTVRARNKHGHPNIVLETGKRRKMWSAVVKYNGVTKRVRFATKQEAIDAVVAMSKEIHGDFSVYARDT